MFSKTSFEQFKTLAQPGKSLAIYQEIAGDSLTPISVFNNLGELTKQATLLESTPASGQQARYSFLGIEPIAELSIKDQIKGLDSLRQFYQQQHCATTHPLSGFLGGVVGFISYDAVRQFEKIPDRHADEENLPDFAFMSYRTNITFDHQLNKVVITRRIEVTEDLQASYQQAMQDLQQLVARIQTANPAKPTNKQPVNTELTVDIDDKQFCELVNKAKSYIKAGDIFQVVLSRRFSKQLNATPFAVYRALRMVSPAPYLFYLDRGDYVITGASPEKLISVEEKQISSFPIAGTRPRGSEAAENKRLEEELLADQKELAEHVMLVDLARNDLGRTCEPGSVQVKSFKQVQHYSHVMHITSEVVGKLDQQYDAFDALAAAFPAGTLSGAPKIRAMEIIDELEHSKRGAYGGVIGFIDNAGNLNSCITIRTAVIRDGKVTVRAGAGIVFDSNPQAEAEETFHKASSVLAAIEMAEGGLQ